MTVTVLVTWQKKFACMGDIYVLGRTHSLSNKTVCRRTHYLPESRNSRTHERERLLGRRTHPRERKATPRRTHPQLDFTTHAPSISFHDARMASRLTCYSIFDDISNYLLLLAIMYGYHQFIADIIISFDDVIK